MLNSVLIFLGIVGAIVLVMFVCGVIDRLNLIYRTFGLGLILICILLFLYGIQQFTLGDAAGAWGIAMMIGGVLGAIGGYRMLVHPPED